MPKAPPSVSVAAHEIMDPTKLKDWQVAEMAEEKLMKPVSEIAKSLGIKDDEMMPYPNNLAKVDLVKTMKRINADPKLSAHKAKYIDVTAVTPTKFGEGKTTTTMGLVEGLAHVYGPEGKVAVGTIRQPSGGPTFNIKGSAAGGGISQCIPLAPFSLGLTGDNERITSAHNLAMTALTSRMQHESNYDDEKLAKIGLKRLDVDPEKVNVGWAIDFCAQALRHITIGQGGHMDGVEMKSGFQMTVSSELMSILAIATDLKDLRARIGRMTLALSRSGKPVTCGDLEVDGAMTAILLDALHPTLVQTVEGQPVFVHAGPFANISIGQSSVIADAMAVHMCDYLVTESGFAADIGYEKFWNIKCRMTGLVPDAVVIVATVRALKSHGEAEVVEGESELALLERGCANLLAHIDIVKKSGTSPVVCINAFYTDKPEEHELIKKLCGGTRCAVSSHWQHGGVGAKDLAIAVHEACEEKNNFKFLYELTMPLKERVEKICKEVYGADGVEWNEDANKKIMGFEADEDVKKYPVCMVKTQMSLSHDPELRNRPTGFKVPIRDVMVYNGAQLVVPIAGDIKLLPGTGSDPAYRRIDVDCDSGRVKGLF